MDAKADSDVGAHTDQEDNGDEQVPEGQYVVEKILNVRVKTYKKQPSKKQYLVQWEGYGKDYNSWEDEANLYCTDKLQEFENARSSKRSGSPRKSATSSRSSTSKRPRGTSTGLEEKDHRKTQTNAPTNGHRQSSTEERDKSKDHHPSSSKVAETVRSAPKKAVARMSTFKHSSVTEESEPTSIEAKNEEEKEAETPAIRRTRVRSERTSRASKLVRTGSWKPSAARSSKGGSEVSGKAIRISERYQPQGRGASQKNLEIDTSITKYDKDLTVLLMENGEILQKQTLKVFKGDVDQIADLQWDPSKVKFPKERVQVIGQMMLLRARSSYYMVIPETAPDMCLGYSAEFMQERYPKTMTDLKKRNVFEGFLE